MTNDMAQRNWVAPGRVIGWGGIAVLLSIPLLAGFPWTLSDYIVMGAMLGIAGLVVELAVRASGNIAYRFGALLAVAASFLLIWVNLAVGILGSEDNPANLMFFAIVLLAAVGSALVRFRARGMAKVMLAAAIGQLLACVIGFGAELGAPGNRGLYEAALGTVLFVPMWLISAGLFARAAEAVSGTAAR